MRNIDVVSVPGAASFGLASTGSPDLTQVGLGCFHVSDLGDTDGMPLRMRVLGPIGVDTTLRAALAARRTAERVMRETRL